MSDNAPVSSRNILIDNTLRWGTSHDLRFSDVDMVGHVNNGAFNSLFETNRGLLFHDASMTAPGKYQYVLVSSQIDYVAELTWPGAADVACGVSDIGTTSLTLVQSIYQGGRFVAAGRFVLVVVEPVSRESVKITEALRRGLTTWKS